MSIQRPWQHPVLIACEQLEVAGLIVDKPTFERVAAAITVDKAQYPGFVLTRLRDLQGLAEEFGFIIANDEDGVTRCYLPGEWPKHVQ